MLNSKRALFPFLCLATCFAAACSNGTGTDGGIDGGNIDICNSPTDGGPTAQNDGQCQLLIEATPAGDAGLAGQQFFIDHQGKTLWLWIELPASVPPNTLFHLAAGYSAPSTPVQLQINLLDAQQKHSVAKLTAPVSGGGTGKPGLIDFEFALSTFTPAGTIMWAEITDAANSAGDVHHPFNIALDMVSNPDVTQGGVISFSAPDSTGTQTGSCPLDDGGVCQGVLALSGQIDAFTINVPGGTGREILYFDLSEPILTPPSNYLLAYQVLNDAGVVINSGTEPNVETQANLQAALLVNPPGGTYTIQVFGVDPNNPNYSMLGPSDNRFTYTLDTELLSDLDPYEPNDNFGETAGNPAANITFASPGATINLNGRISYFGDRDLFALHFPASSQPTRLHYKMTAQTSGNRFPAVNAPPDRLLNTYLDIPPVSGGSNATECLSNPAVCPTDPEYVNTTIDDAGTPSYQSGILNDYCVNGDGDGGALCVLSAREEATAEAEGFSPLQNFEGIVPLMGNGAQDLWLDLIASGGQYADDVPYTIALTWETMPNPLSSQANPLTFGTLGGSNTTVSGQISVGYGYLHDYDFTNSPPVDVRGQDDYDATPSTADVWEVGIPSGYGYPGATWGLSYTVTAANGGMPNEQVLLGVTFCDAMMGCSVQGPSPVYGFPGAILYSQNADLPWYDIHGTGIYYGIHSFAPDWITTPIAGGDSITASPSSCTCIEPSFLPAGKFYVTVAGVDRTAWTDTNYTLSMNISSYPQSTGITNDAGTVVQCPIGLPTAGDAGTEDGGPGCAFIDGF